MNTRKWSLCLALVLGFIPTTPALACTAAPPAIWHDDFMFVGQSLPPGSRVYLDSMGAPATELTLTQGETVVVLDALEEFSNLGQHTHDYARFVTVFATPTDLAPGNWQVTPGGGVSSDGDLRVSFSAEVQGGEMTEQLALSQATVSWVYHEANNCSEYDSLESDPTRPGNSFRVDLQFDVPPAPSAGWVAQVLEAKTGTLAAMAPIIGSTMTLNATYFVPETESEVCFNTRIFAPLGQEAQLVSSCVALDKEVAMAQEPQTLTPTPVEDDEVDTGQMAFCSLGGKSSAADSAAALLLLLAGLGLRRRD